MKRQRRRAKRRKSALSLSTPIACTESVEPTAVGPTPETAAKLRRDPIHHLRSQPQWTAGYERAVEEIARVYEMVGQGLFARGFRYTEQSGGGRPVPDWLALMHRDKYLPWMRILKAKDAVAGTDLCGIAIDIIVFRCGLRQVERKYRIANGRAKSALFEALDLYCENEVSMRMDQKHAYWKIRLDSRGQQMY